MEAFRAIGWLGALVWLSGCTNGDVRMVKDSVWKAMPDTTVGKALDTRQACEKVKWSSFEDERGRNIVQYECTYRFARAYFEKSTQTQIAELDAMEASRSVSEKSRLSDERARLQRLADDLAQRERAEAVRSTDSEDQARSTYQSDLATLASMQDCHRFDLTRFQLQGDMDLLRRAARQCASRGDPQWAEEYERMRASRVAQLEAALRRDDDRRSERKGRLDYARRQLEQEQAALEAREAAQPQEQEKARASAAAQRSALQSRLKDFRQVTEVTQWSVVQGDVVFVTSYAEMEFAGQKERGSFSELGLILEARGNTEKVTPLVAETIDPLWRRYKATAQPGRA